MNQIKAVTIEEEPNEIDDHLLDILGGEFNFDHEKGLSEWIKNSADAYIRNGVPDNEQFVVLRFTDGEDSNSMIECIDFVGMDSLDIQKAFKRWGDPEAARRGLKKKVYGGHGNGGKFYMRQMFAESYFITFKKKLLNIYGFSKKRKYGFAKGKKDFDISVNDALKQANIDKIAPLAVKSKIESGKTGFTVVRGFVPKGMPRKIKALHLCSRLQNHPQARRILKRIPVSVIHNNKVIIERLEPETIHPKLGFDNDLIIPIPAKLMCERSEKIVSMESDKFKRGKLILKTSDIALTGQGKFGDLNRIDIIGELGVIGSYKVLELGINNFTQSVFIYGECECSILEDPQDCAIRNDREKLVINDRSSALLGWIAKQVDELSDKITDQENKKQEEISKKLSSKYNDFLNQWKNKFMKKIFDQVFGGSGDGPGGGFGTGGSSGSSSGNGDGSGGDSNGSNSGDKKGGGNEPVRASKFPEVKLSRHDDDPFNPGHQVVLEARQPVIYQRPQDVKHRIYWINTATPLAASILENPKYGANSLRWRDFLLQRYVDIFIREGLEKFAKKYPESFNKDGVDQKIDEITLMVHDAAYHDLEEFLFDEKYEPKTQISK